MFGPFPDFSGYKIFTRTNGTIMNQPTFRFLQTLTILAAASVAIPLGSSRALAVDPVKPATPVAAAPATQPGVDAVRAAIDSKDYSGAVRLAGKMLALHGPAAAGLSRFQLTMLKGDAQAGMKSISTAVMTYKSAMKETKDPREIALAKWTAELFHTANSNVFTPKVIAVGAPAQGPFDLMIPDQRKLAFGVLLDDQLALIDPKIKAATVSQNLPTIWPVLQQVEDLDQLDVIANGSDDKTSTLASSLLDHSRNLLTNALKEYWARVGDIDTRANVTTTTQQQVYVNNSLVTQSVTKKNGLTQSNTSELKNIIDMAQKIHDAANAFMAMAKSDSGWSTILSDADRVAGKASDVLSADYSDTTTTTGNSSTEGYGIPPGNQFGVSGGGVNAQATTPTPPPKKSNAPTTPAKSK
jgi:hypothetical protein